MLSFYVKFVQTDRQMDRQTDVLTNGYLTLSQTSPGFYVSVIQVS